MSGKVFFLVDTSIYPPTVKDNSKYTIKNNYVNCESI